MSCDNFCEYHGEVSTMVKEHSKNIVKQEGILTETKKIVDETKGKIDIFLVIFSILLVILCSASIYGVTELNDFKTIYMQNYIDLNSKVIEISENVGHNEKDIIVLKDFIEKNYVKKDYVKRNYIRKHNPNRS